MTKRAVRRAGVILGAIVSVILSLLMSMPMAAQQAPSASPALPDSSSGALAPTPCAILLHGITKDASSMTDIEDALRETGFYTVNLDYPSKKHPIETLAEMTVPRGLAACKKAGATPIYFVAHSMGSLLLRQYFDQRDASVIERAVMLGPPNQGSRLGNFLSCIPIIKDVNGPAGNQMGIDERSLPSRLGPVRFPLGVIAGTRSFNPLFSAIIDGNDDGIVGVPSTYVEGTCARVTYPLTHNGLTGSQQVIDQVVSYLTEGRFVGEEVEYFGCGP
ncbi:alpha/beta hydrolase [Microbulbifer agarilyticus]|uniref:esterase/lipase family protein n=1 Tax=Microbulbifer agarilyticus TaxID=260552 RepID=UPI001C951C79|nr:alpha/beta hydrolase [Microbulbifer agarilyticus]MBY6190996.1 alpha/beta hydrolase [Microbulbifer agarilyticus]